MDVGVFEAFRRRFGHVFEVNYATMFGLATVLTEQGETGKLMQAEALNFKGSEA